MPVEETETTAGLNTRDLVVRSITLIEGLTANISEVQRMLTDHGKRLTDLERDKITRDATFKANVNVVSVRDRWMGRVGWLVAAAAGWVYTVYEVTQPHHH